MVFLTVPREFYNSPFENCSNNSDSWIYVNGSATNVEEIDTFMNSYEAIVRVEDLMNKTVLFLLVAGLTVNIFFIAIVLYNFHSCHLPFQLYYFLLNRAVCDCLACSLLTVPYIWYLLHILMPKSLSIIIVGSNSFLYYANFATNISVSLLKLIAVKEPLIYMTRVTKKLCICLMSLTWIIGGAFAFLLTTPDFGPNFYCATHYECATIGKVFWLTTAGLSFSSILFILGLTVYYVNKSQRAQRKSLWKLVVINSVFVIFNVLELPGVYLHFEMNPTTNERRDVALDSGKCVLYGHEESKKELNLALFHLVWAVLMHCRAIADPVANVLVDENLRNFLKNQIAHFSCRMKS